VAGGEDHALAVASESTGELCDARRLADAVHADDEDHRGTDGTGRLVRLRLAVFLAIVFSVRIGPAPELPLRLDRPEQADERLAYLFGLLHPLAAHAAAQVVEDAFSSRQAGIGADQDLLELIPQLVVDLRALKDAEHAPEEAALGAAERPLSLLDEILAELRL